MRGLGTLINVAAILAGGVLGCFAGNRLKETMRETLIDVTGVGVAVIGMGGVLAQMLTIAEDGTFATHGTIMMVVCLAAGAVIGELLQIEEKIVRFGEWLKAKSGSTGDRAFVSAFVSTSCTVCIGAMAVMGSIQDGISGDFSVLAVKGLLDAIIVCVMTAAQGKGCVFSAVPVGLFQGSITLLAVFAGNFLPQASLNNLSYVGSVLILCVGLNLMREKQIRVANALPAIVLAAAWGFFGA